MTKRLVAGFGGLGHGANTIGKIGIVGEASQPRCTIDAGHGLYRYELGRVSPVGGARRRMSISVIEMAHFWFRGL